MAETDSDAVVADTAVAEADVAAGTAVVAVVAAAVVVAVAACLGQILAGSLEQHNHFLALPAPLASLEQTGRIGTGTPFVEASVVVELAQNSSLAAE